MKLEQLIAMRKNSKFSYQGLPAIVLEHRFSPKENTGSVFDAPAFLTMYFEVTRSDKSVFRIVLTSMWPDPQTLTLPNYA